MCMGVLPVCMSVYHCVLLLVSLSPHAAMWVQGTELSSGGVTRAPAFVFTYVCAQGLCALECSAGGGQRAGVAGSCKLQGTDLRSSERVTAPNHGSHLFNGFTGTVA